MVGLGEWLRGGDSAGADASVPAPVEDWRGALGALVARPVGGPSNAEVVSFLARLGLPGLLGGLDGPGLIDRLDALEQLKAAAAAEQARVQVEFALLCEAGMDPRAAALESRTGRAAARVGERSASAQIALARRVSPARGARLLAASRRLVADLPCTLGALSAGQLSEDRAVWVAEGVEVLSPDARAVVDEALAGHPRRLEGLGDRGVQDAVRAAVDAVDDSGRCQIFCVRGDGRI